MSNVPEQNNDLAQTLARLADRLDHIEIQLQQSTRDHTPSTMETTSTSEQENTSEAHSAITERLPDTEFHPYSEFEEHLTGFRKDFFRPPLSEIECRKILAGCLRNMEREYNPPTLNTVNMAANNRFTKKERIFNTAIVNPKRERTPNHSSRRTLKPVPTSVGQDIRREL
ncbi:hypothetical protein Unana1_06210, partial [Umbelopsis nana]